MVAFPRAMIVFCNLIHCFATFSLTFPSSLLKLSIDLFGCGCEKGAKQNCLINEYNSLHVNMHQTYQLSPLSVKLLRENHRFLEYIIINIDTQIVPLFFCLRFGRFALLHTRNNKEDGWQMKEIQKVGFQ